MNKEQESIVNRSNYTVSLPSMEKNKVFPKQKNIQQHSTVSGRIASKQVVFLLDSFHYRVTLLLTI